MRMFKTVVIPVGVVVLVLQAGIGVGAIFVPTTPQPEIRIEPIPPPPPRQLNWRDLAQIQEEKHGLYPGLLEGTCEWETQGSKNRSTAKSHKGAIGICQVLPGTAAWLAGIYPEDPKWQSVLRIYETILQDDQTNMYYAGLYMKVCYKRKSVARALYCYNSGHNARWKGPNRYVRMVGAKVHTINQLRLG